MAGQVEKMVLRLRLVFYRSGGCWMAHCLETDLIGRGTTREEAMESLTELTATQIQESVLNGNVENIFQAADPVYQQMFFVQGPKAYGKVEHYELENKPRTGHVELWGYEVHEYEGQLTYA